MEPPVVPSLSARSPSLSSTIIARSDSSISISSTPATSNTDSSSVSTPMNNEDVFRAAAEAGANAALSGDQNNRVKRVRKSLLASYNENVLSGTAKRKSMDKESGRMVSGKALVTSVGMDGGLLGESIQVSDLEWRASDGECSSPTPGQAETDAAGGPDTVKRRRSTRLELVAKAKGAFAGVGSGATSMVDVLGKRPQEGSKGARNVLEGLRGSSLGLQGIEKQSTEQMGEPLKKKARFSEASTARDKSPARETNPVLPPRPRRKLWLSHGLYVDQGLESKAHLTERKKKSKAISRRGSREKKPFLPLPTFGERRLLEDDRDFKLPFDVFSPLPTRQPKPEEWRKVAKSMSQARIPIPAAANADRVQTLDVFIGEAAEIWKKNKINEVSKCVCTPERGCDEDCQNRHMFYECDENNCAVGPERCTNRSFRDLKERCKLGGKYNIGVEVFKTEDRGYGVRANRTFEPNQIILEYAGEIITQDECERRMKKEYKKKECFYLMVFDQNMIIDATRGSIARFVNHSCEPNCKMVKWTVSGKPRMALFAGENGVMTGEELCYDYNFDPFSIKNVQECRCASVNCRGVLGPKQPPTKEQKKEIVKPLVRHAKRKLKQFLGDGKGASSSSSRTKKRKLAAPRSTKSLTTRAKTTLKTTVQGNKGRNAPSNLSSQGKRQITYRVTRRASTPSIVSGTRSAKLQSKQKTVLKRVSRSVKTRSYVDESTISVRSSPRKKVKTFKAVELSRAVKVAGKQSDVKTAVIRVKRGVVRSARGSKAKVMAGTRGKGK